MILSLKDIGLICDANIDIGKITVIAGKNSTGKSTSSKILYSFLKSNSAQRGELAIDTIVKQIVRLVFDLNDYARSTARNSDIDNYDSDDLFSIFKELDDDKSKDFDSKLEVYEKIKEYYSKIELKPGFKYDIDESLKEIDDLIKIVKENQESLYNSIMKKLLKSEFPNYKFKGNIALKGSYKGTNYDYLINFNNKDIIDDDSFVTNGWFTLPDVFYLDSFSILDLSQKTGIQNTDHAKNLARALKPESDESIEVFDEKINKSIIKIEKRVIDLINGEFVYDNGVLSFVPKDGSPCLMRNTASGVKQIGLIQLLLRNRKLKRNSFLIIDEPEVNLHPEWQLKLAEVLILLTKELNITIYVNTHSPMFVEAIEVISEYVGLKDDVNYYLTEGSDDQYSINKISNDEIYKIYNNLAEPYGRIDVYRLRTEYENEH